MKLYYRRAFPMYPYFVHCLHCGSTGEVAMFKKEAIKLAAPCRCTPRREIQK